MSNSENDNRPGFCYEEIDRLTGSTAQSERSPLKKISQCSAMMKVNRPLIPLKVCLFFFFAAGAAVSPFIQVNLLQLGITVPQLSSIYMISPIVYFLGPAISGIIADKIGQAKPVFVANMMVAVISLNAMLLIPTLKKHCPEESILFDCPVMQESRRTNVSFPCHKPGNYNVRECQYVCFTDSDHAANPSCEIDDESEHCKSFPVERLNFTMISVFAIEGASNDTCLYRSIASMSDNSSKSWCSELSSQNCNLLCLMESEEEHCTINSSDFLLVFSLSLVLLMTFTTVMSNCYRMLDVTAMHMVKDHDSDFGRVRFWSILSSTLIPPLAGILVDKFSKVDANRNYALAFYLFDAMIVITTVAVWKLDVRISPPGKNMWRMSLSLLKRSEFLAFALVLLFLGTSWGLAKNYSNVYLKSIGAEDLLLGLVTATNSLAGLPFLLTSNWWVQKVGTTNILLLGFLGYAVYFLGYYFMINPWYAIPTELTAVLTYHLLWVAVVRHSHATAPEGLTATVIASAGGIHYGIGKGTGSLVAGYVRSGSSEKTKVDPLTYIFAAGMSASSLILYGLFLYCKGHMDKRKAARNNRKDEIDVSEDNDKMEKLSSV